MDPADGTIFSLTLILSRHEVNGRAVGSVLERFRGLRNCHLFFVYQGVRLVGCDWSGLPPGERYYCAFDHQRYGGPQSHGANYPGGLANLGALIRKSDAVLCYPGSGCPLAPIRKRGEPLGILLDSSPGLAVEGLRMAVGLVGCDFSVTLYAAFPRIWLTFADLVKIQPDAGDFIDALTALGGLHGGQPLAVDGLDQRVMLTL